MSTFGRTGFRGHIFIMLILDSSTVSWYFISHVVQGVVLCFIVFNYFVELSARLPLVTPMPRYLGTLILVILFA